MWIKTGISGVYCECICIPLCMQAGRQNAAVFILCALLREQLKSLNVREWVKAGVLNPTAVKTEKAI